MEDIELGEETKQERRERRCQKKREKILQHGRGLARLYRDVVLKHLKAFRQKLREINESRQYANLESQITPVIIRELPDEK